MKSTTTYEMHSYSTNSMPSVSRNDANINEDATAIISNSGGCEKYSLRQRHKRRTVAETLNAAINSYLSDDNYDNNNNSEPECAASGSCDATTTTTTRTNKPKSTVRKRAGGNDITTVAATTNNNHSANSTKPTKAKTKAAPLSKYRRKTANARERTRMREINSAFENLRHCVPHTITGDEAAQSNEKLTKITTLRLAMKYIHILSEALANPSFEADFLLECKRDGDHRFTTHNWQQTPRVVSAAEAEFDDQDLEPNIEPQPEKKPPKTRSPASKVTSKPAKSTGVAVAKTVKNAERIAAVAAVTVNASAAPRKAPAKRQTKKQKMQQSISPYNSSHSSSSPRSSLSTSAYASLSSAATSSPCSSASNSSSYLIDSPVNAAYMQNLNHSMSDLSNLNLESDGESLHLSESCLSPPNYVVPGGSTSTTTALFPQAHKQQPLVDVLSPFDQMTSTLENPLELSLRLLDSSADSLDFSGAGGVATDQHAPSSCISPLDPFNPFSDLLHVDFPEHNALDLFLT